MARAEITAEYTKSRLSYDQETGVFTWRKRTSGPRVECWNARYEGKPAGHICPRKGYLRIGLQGTLIAAHRLAWLYVHGVWPIDQIDHIDGIRSNNRITNLRQANVGENNQNVGLSKRNNSGLLGVSWNERRGKWAAAIHAQNRNIHLGRYGTKEEAYAVYLAAKKDLHSFQPVPRMEGRE